MSDVAVFLRWWFFVGLLGIIFMPLSLLVFTRMKDRGWIFSKAVGIAISGWFIWFLSSCHILKFNTVGAWISVIVCAALNGALFYRLKKKGSIDIDSGTIRQMAISELVFFLMFAFWTYLRCFSPEASGTTEKLMDFGIMQAINRSDYMPAHDMWFAGEPINYYYVGQFMAVFLSKFTGVGTEFGYNLTLTMLAAFAFAMPFVIVSNAVSDMLKAKEFKGEIIPKYLPKVSGILAGIAVSMAGNMQYVIYARLVPALRSIFGLDTMAESLGYSYPDYFFSNATRYIGYNPDTNDKTIHEFPSYSFTLGDLHAHVINIMFVLTVTGILYAFLQLKKDSKGSDKKSFKEMIPEVLSPSVLLVSFLIGLFHTTNYWDYPIYYVVAGAVILFSNAREYDFKLYTLKLTVLQGVCVIAIAKLVSLPFTLNFDKISASVKMCENHTPFYQLCVLWLLPVLSVSTLFVSLIKEQKETGVFDKKGSKTPAVFKFIAGIDINDLYMITIGLCAIGLILLPEIIYVEDIYGGDFKRANTMFKLTYQAFILFGMAMVYSIIRLILFARTKWRRLFAVILLFCLLLTSGYFGLAAKSCFGDWLNRDNIKGLNNANYLFKQNANDFFASRWINEHIDGAPVMLEVNGDSYKPEYCRISARTGLPTILGWKTHEWLWRSAGNADYPEVLTDRARDVEIIYTSSNPDEVRELLKKYNVEYIYVGDTEREEFGDPEKHAAPVNHELLQSMGTVVYPAGFDPAKSGEVTYIIKVD